MRRTGFVAVPAALLLLLRLAQFDGNPAPSPDVEFRNAPVLFKKNGKSYQQVFARYLAASPGKMLLAHGGEALLKADVRKGENFFLLDFPAVAAPEAVTISAKIDDHPEKNYPVTLLPPKKWQIYFVQHSHTDIGYTRPQSEILAEHLRSIDAALDYCDQTDGMPDDAKFRWTCESSWVTREYLRTRPKAQTERLIRRIAEGRIEVTGMYANMSEIADENVMYDFLEPLREFDKRGIPVRTAMQNDVNGVAWCLPDYFKNTGVKYLVMGSHKDRSILPFDKPTAFWWETPAGERLLAFRGDHYLTGNNFGLAGKEINPAKLLWHLADLDAKGYPFDRIGIQYSGYRADNSPPSTAASALVMKWNAAYEYPKLRLAVAGEFPQYVERHFADRLPVYRNAWLDWWSDGFGSAARETAEVRKTQNMKQVAEGVLAMVALAGGGLNSALASKLEHVSENLIFFDEHTFGAAESVKNNYSENSSRQWLQKSAYAWEALKKATLLHEEALGLFQEFLMKADAPLVYVVNSLGWTRSGAVEIAIGNQLIPAGNGISFVDDATGTAMPAQLLHEGPAGSSWALEVGAIPALGAKAFRIAAGAAPPAAAGKSVRTLENRFYRVMIDGATGAISSLFDKELNLDLADSQNPYAIGQPVRETLSSRKEMTATRTTVSNVTISAGSNGPVWESVRIAADLAGFSQGAPGLPKGIELEIRLYKNVKKLEFVYLARKERRTDPEALYVAFPFALPDSRIVFETIGATLAQGQQLPGSSSDWNAAQNFVAVRGKRGQIVIVSDEVPLWQFSDFNIGRYERYPQPGKTWLYSWVMNNYWHTNFRAFQEGGFSWRYQLTSSSDTTNTFATRFSWGERNHFSARVVPAGAPGRGAPTIETLAISGPAHAMLVNSRPAFTEQGAVLLHFRELEGLPAEVTLSSAVPGRSIRRIVEVNTIGTQIGEPVASVRLKPYEARFFQVEFGRN